ncbi:MAG: dihydroorotate dehydrogenase electron transfer subunit [Melioribacteraceae bacterium]|nr:dihydroorotate dehydrogenase electron transfer subunit [Melioribacteraceae bacterium]
MIIEKCIVQSIEKVKSNIFLLKVLSPNISTKGKAGQFCNIKVSENDFPLLRRPFSIHYIENESIYFLFDVHGEGTNLLSQKKIGDIVDIIGPLGNGFNINEDFETAVLVAGGIGVAPFPLLTKSMVNKSIITFYGARNSEYIYDKNLLNINYSTDDGSIGLKGNVIDLLKINLKNLDKQKIKIFGCGPSPMLKALQIFANENNIKCELALESVMACGFGICQGCPIETVDNNYKLICKDGPVFDAKEIIL